jgi:hypothetical protein
LFCIALPPTIAAAWMMPGYFNCLQP